MTTAEPLARYGAMWKARVASGSATVELHHLLGQDRVVASWIAGWALSRGVAPPTPAYGGFRVDVGMPDQKARYVFPEISVGVQKAASSIIEPHVFLKVCASPHLVRQILNDDWQIKPVSFMMTSDSFDRTSVHIPAHYRVEREPMLAGYAVSILAEDGNLAASGRVFPVDALAVFDRIETHPNHRRRGLGRAVMAELAAVALDCGAARGALVATPDGRALYSALGWQLHALYTTAVRE